MSETQLMVGQSLNHVGLSACTLSAVRILDFILLTYHLSRDTCESEGSGKLRSGFTQPPTPILSPAFVSYVVLGEFFSFSESVSPV